MRLTTAAILCSRRLVHVGAGAAPSSGKPTALAKELYSDILFSGPITVAEYMQRCLTHPKHGYYTTQPQIFGASGDFVTSPQISPVFSEMLAVWIAQYVSHQQQQSSKSKSTWPRFRLVELGPGSATLQKVLLPALARLKCTPASLHLIDASPELQNAQRRVLETLPSSIVPSVKWYTSTDDAFSELALSKLDDDQSGPGNHNDTLQTIFLAHEFFDALPVHIFQRINASGPQSRKISRWRELLVDAVPDNPSRASLRLVISPTPTPASALLNVIRPSHNEDVVEVCPRGLTLARELAKRVCTDGGAALIIDYGDMKRRGATIRAIAKHSQTNLLTTPGAADMTADVDFGALQKAVSDEGASFVGAITQRSFLLRLGFAHRMRLIAKAIVDSNDPAALVDEKLQRLQLDYNRLVGQSESEMGQLYKVAAIFPTASSPIPGFEDAVQFSQTKSLS